MPRAGPVADMDHGASRPAGPGTSLDGYGSLSATSAIFSPGVTTASAVTSSSA